jgi:hypothetical protein
MHRVSASSALRDWDAIRFSVARVSPEQVTICFVCELAHAPIEHGKLTFDLASEVWLNVHPDPRVLESRKCYLQTYRARQALSHLTTQRFIVRPMTDNQGATITDRPTL